VTTYGIDSAGFSVKPYDVIKAELEADFKTTFGAGINLHPSAPFGQLVGILAERHASLWQLAEAVYAAATPDGAEGISLVHLAALTGTSPKAATLTKVAAVCTGSAGAVLLAGRRASVVGTRLQFETLEGVTLAAVGAVARSTAYAVGDLVTSDGKVYRCAVAGLSSSSTADAPSGEDPGQVDGSVTWDYVGGGTAAGTVSLAAVDPGPVQANAGSLTVIETPVAGWSGIYNPEDPYLLGSNTETDAELRLRREAELRAQGNAALEAVRQAVLQVEDVREAVVFENVTDTTDADGRPMKSIEVLVDGGADASVAGAIFASKSAGVQAFGLDVVESVEDSQGIAHEIRFSRPVQTDLWLRVTVYYDPDKWPADGSTQIQEAIASWGESIKTGDPVYRSAVLARVFATSGVVNADLPQYSLNGYAWTAADYETGVRELVDVDTSRIVVLAFSI